MRELSIGQCASLACLLEVSAPKPGNVHRGADFEDMTFADFAASRFAIFHEFQHSSVRESHRTPTSFGKVPTYSINPQFAK